MDIEDEFYSNDIIQNNISPPFCDCEFPRKIDVINNKNCHELCNCKCVENGFINGKIDWNWHKKTAHSESFVDKNNITFHPVYSQGTAFVRGEKRLDFSMIHYWEIQIITSPSGTDQMFGIGTEKIKFEKYRNVFVSGLGRDKNSWGFSYRGFKIHNGVVEKYGKRITQGCIIGIYLDLFHGYLKYYLNRKSLGVAFKNIPLDPNVQLYPMVCSTSSRCSIRLLNSTSQPVSLQFQILRTISKNSSLLRAIKKYPGLKPLLNEYWFLISSTKYSHRSKENELPLDDEVVLSKKAKTKNLNHDEQVFSTDNIYENINNFSVRLDDEDSVDNGMFLLL